MLNYAGFFEMNASPRLRTVALGTLVVPTGQLYCCDPFLSGEVAPLDLRVKPGDHAVDLCLAKMSAWGERVALARLCLSRAPVISWRKAAYRAGGELRSGFRVDAGMACFMDAVTRESFVKAVEAWHAKGPDTNYYDDLLAELFKRNADPARPQHAGDWAMHTPVAGAHENLALFASGLGDGIYDAHWGIDASGQPAMLVVDFGLLPLAPDEEDTDASWHPIEPT
jgi:hypothetical protein